MVIYCFKCHSEVVFDAEHIGKNGRKIPLDPTTRGPHDCPEREKIEQKNDHGNELVQQMDNVRKSAPDLFVALAKDDPRFIVDSNHDKKYVDHTIAAKGLQKVKFFIGTGEEVEEDYNGFRWATHGKINVFGTQLAVDNGIIYFSLNYEETKQ